MRALRVVGPRRVEVQDVPDLVAGPGQILLDVERVGICGTDVELYTGEMAYYQSGRTTFPVQLGHEWTGRVTAVGQGVSTSWIGKRITGDTMLGCTKCDVCATGKTYLCDSRIELGITDGWGGALAEQMLIPEFYAHEVPDTISVAAAAMIEPGGNSLRTIQSAQLKPGEKILILGAGTIGLLAAQFALAEGLDVTIASDRPGSLQLARELGVPHTSTFDELEVDKRREFHAVVDASTRSTMPEIAINKVLPGGRVVLIGLSETPSLIDTRFTVLHDITVIGILSASPGLVGAIELFASGKVNPEPLVAEVVGFREVAERLEGRRGSNAGPGPKIHVDPRWP
jgi:threonine dehydrogenase-like Zn-dependent dehydrogenase